MHTHAGKGRRSLKVDRAVLAGMRSAGIAAAAVAAVPDRPLIRRDPARQRARSPGCAPPGPGNAWLQPWQTFPPTKPPALESSLIGVVGVKLLLSPHALPAGHSLFFAVGAGPPHDGVRKAKRLNLSRDLRGIAALAARFPGAAVLAFGFGDRAFVLARHEEIGVAIGALLPSPGLILVTALKDSLEAAYGARYVVVLLHVSPAALDSIAWFIWYSLATKCGRRPPPYGPGPCSGSLFYASSVRYDGFYTCNTWAAEALGAGGLPIQAAGVLFAFEVMREARTLASH